MNVFLFRTASSVVLIALFLTSILWRSSNGRWLFTAFCAAMSILAVREFLKMLDNVDRQSYPFATELTAVAVMLAILLGGSVIFAATIALAFILYCWAKILFSRNDIKVLEKIVNSIAAVFLVIFPLSVLAILYMRGEGTTYQGRFLVLYLVIVTKCGDIGAYVTGVSSNNLMRGNHKIFPKISPKKSWEGTIGGLVLSVIVSASLWNALQMPGGFWWSIPVGCALFAGGFAGDLSESSLKRMCEIKDSGALVPGIGGVLDVLDSLLLNAPIFCLLYLFIQHRYA